MKSLCDIVEKLLRPREILCEYSHVGFVNVNIHWGRFCVVKSAVEGGGFGQVLIWGRVQEK